MKAGFRLRSPVRAAFLLAIAIAPSVAAPLAAQAEASALAALESGEYDDAIRQLRRLARGRDGTVAVHRALVRALAEVGRYDEAEEAARDGRDRHAAELENVLGEVLVERGRHQEAAASFRAAMAGGADDDVTARVNLAELQLRTGQRDEAMRAFDGFIDFYNRTTSLSSAELTAVGIAVRHLGVEESQLLQDALRAFDEAVAADPSNPEPHLRTGQLFLDTYRSPDARESYQQVLARNPRHPQAILGMALAHEFDGSPEAMGTARSALEINPNLVPARTLLARLHLRLEEYPAAETEARAALEVNPSSLEALSVLAATFFLRDRHEDFEAVREQVRALNPQYPGLLTTVADMAVQTRRYADAVTLAAEAVEIDPYSWKARGILGINQLRVGAIEQGQAELERAFAGDPFNPWYKNTLDLLDTFERYRITETEHFVIAIDGREAELLAPFVAELAEQTYQALAERYQYEPPTPIRLELFPSHADFSVRTVGLAGLGALGVSFGSVVAMDSPSARNRGEFNWASTLWHEIAHVFHLALSNHRVPRWLAEGFAVYEQRRGAPSWGHNLNPGFLIAYNQGRVLPVSQLNNGFVRPSYGDQVVHSYYQASLVCELIARDHGPEALVAMLREYAAGATTEEVFERVLGTEIERFDRIFTDYFEERFAGALAAVEPLPALAERGSRAPDEVRRLAVAHPDNFMAQMAMGAQLFDEERFDEAEEYLGRARDLFPEYAGPGSPGWLLARIHIQRGDSAGALHELETLTSIDESFLAANLEESQLREAAGDGDGAIEALQRAVNIYPFDEETHGRLAELAAGRARHPVAVRAREALVALDPVDMAGALYQLALAQYQAGDVAGARRTVLRALERAPNFEAAQDLLMTLRGSPEPQLW
ncbi:MAG: tetratricopeptide repeat protein [Gammaproteobacteria bacterium]|nr:tetratricopeptide repeat protein [Gammaproteobacteria bacterium]MYF61380.1 tetratricopeptide repeat protein [Gammaproteobacteria bacterium]MYI22516.1 tetratricopeptide repeat protein [Gammaproteobacteria bacterium]